MKLISVIINLLDSFDKSDPQKFYLFRNKYMLNYFKYNHHKCFINNLKFIFFLFKSLILSFKLMPIMYEIELEKHYTSRRKDSKNPFLQSIKRYSLFSQSDEDSIIDEIIKRLDIKKGYFLELGVGNGLQNNTLNLLSKSWEGI